MQLLQIIGARQSQHPPDQKSPRTEPDRIVGAVRAMQLGSGKPAVVAHSQNFVDRLRPEHAQHWPWSRCRNDLRGAIDTYPSRTACENDAKKMSPGRRCRCRVFRTSEPADLDLNGHGVGPQQTPGPVARDS